MQSTFKPVYPPAIFFMLCLGLLAIPLLAGNVTAAQTAPTTDPCVD